MTKETLKETFSKETFWVKTKEQRYMKDLVKERDIFVITRRQFPGPFHVPSIREGVGGVQDEVGVMEG